MSGYIGTQPVPQATQTRDSFTATSGQTTFATGGYTPNFLDVYLNGVKLASADYTAANGSDVVLASGAATGDILEVVAFTTFNVTNTATAAQGTLADSAVQPNDSPTFGTVTATSYAGDGSSLTGIAAGAGGGGSDEIFWENDQNVTTNYTITNNKNAMSAGPITVNSGITVTVGSGETWTVV
jgi:hypothetical protein